MIDQADREGSERDLSTESVNFGVLRQILLTKQKEQLIDPDDTYLLHVIENFVGSQPKFASLADFLVFLRAAATREIDDDIREQTIQACIVTVADFAGRNFAVREPSFRALEASQRNDAIASMQDQVETRLFRLLNEAKAADAGGTTPPSSSSPQ